MAMKKRVKCIKQDYHGTLQLNQCYEVVCEYMDKEFLILNHRGYEMFYPKDLFIEVG